LQTLLQKAFQSEISSIRFRITDNSSHTHGDPYVVVSDEVPESDVKKAKGKQRANTSTLNPNIPDPADPSVPAETNVPPKETPTADEPKSTSQDPTLEEEFKPFIDEVCICFTTCKFFIFIFIFSMSFRF